MEDHSQDGHQYVIEGVNVGSGLDKGPVESLGCRVAVCVEGVLWTYRFLRFFPGFHFSDRSQYP
jgi:hypothetical protein